MPHFSVMQQVDESYQGTRCGALACHQTRHSGYC
jgi:hypothetical protein